MKKIMFNDKYCLTQAVLNGQKTQTRRIAKHQHWSHHEVVNVNDNQHYIDSDTTPQYQIGEIVAVAQSYRKAIPAIDWVLRSIYQNKAGWNNKMFVRANIMPHRIIITNVRIERIQDISDEDCKKEGVCVCSAWTSSDIDGLPIERSLYKINGGDIAHKPQVTYAELIDRISGKGTWANNPWVWVYDFKLINN